MHYTVHLMAIALSGLPMIASECSDDPVPPTCDQISLAVDYHGTATIVNNNASPITLDVHVAGDVCSSSDQVWSGDYRRVTLASEEVGYYSATEPPESGLDVYCCQPGYAQYMGTASLTLIEAGCTLYASTSWTECLPAYYPFL